MNKKLISLALAAALGGATFAASAQQAAGIAAGPMMVYPTLELIGKHNDNLAGVPDNAAKRSSNIFVVAPAVRAEAKSGANVYGITARVEDGTYASSKADNYTDYRLGADASLALTGRAGLKLRADYNQGHDDRGSVVGAAGGATPSRYTTTGVSGIFGYGAEGSKGRIELDGGYTSKRYDNNRYLTATTGQQLSDHDDTKYGATFFWRVMPKTQLLFQAGQTRIDYDDGAYAPTGGPALDSVETRYLAGVTWDATAATTGIFKVGHFNKNFKSSRLADYSGITWEGTVQWKPLSYSGIDFSASRKPNEASLGSSSIDTTTGVTWNHAWSSRVSSALSYSNQRVDYKGVATARRDTTDTYGAKLSYQVQRWLKVGAGYDYTDKTSNAANSDFNRNVVSVFLTGSL